MAPYFVSTPQLRRKHAPAERAVASVRSELGSGRWKRDVRTGCPVEYDGNVVIEGRAVVQDASGKVRAYAVQSGTEDSAGVWRLYYDNASRLRVVVITWANYMGASSKAVVLFDSAGRVELCSSPPDDATWVCRNEEPPRKESDPEVAVALSPKASADSSAGRRDSDPLDRVRALDPMAEFSKCQTPYRPHQ